MPNPRDYDATVARIAGNLLSGLMPHILDSTPAYFRNYTGTKFAVENAVYLARAIVAEVRRTEPPKE